MAALVSYTTRWDTIVARAFVDLIGQLLSVSKRL